MYAVVQLNWHQYIVTEGQELIVDKVLQDEGSELLIEDVLLVFDKEGAKVKVWQPKVAKAKVVADVVSHQKWDKITVIKFKRKNRYQRTKGFRPHQTILKIKSVALHD